MAKVHNPTNAAKDESRRFEIRTPVKTFTGVRGRVHFANGVGSTGCYDDALHCHQLGYAVTENGQPFAPDAAEARASRAVDARAAE